MSLTYGANSAFARPADSLDDGSAGLTKREYFAAMAMQGLAANPDPISTSGIARIAVSLADALIAELNKAEAQE